MATVRMKESGSYLARWWGRDGRRYEEATGIYDFRKAQRAANYMESVHRFWEEHTDGVWQVYANMGFSPKFCHESFSHSKHIRLDQFKKLMSQGGVVFKPANQWRDRQRKKMGGKRYRWHGRLLTLNEIIDRTGVSINLAALRWRLDSGWSLDDAVLKPTMTRADAGRLGADKTNNTKRCQQ